jgi:hypothetical protein
MIDDQHETTESAPESVVPPPPSSYGWHFWRWPRVSQFVIGMPISKEEMSLVVTMLDFTNNSVAENTKTRYGINFGTTKVSLSVPARLHYAIDLSGDRPVAFEVDGVNNIFTAVFLDPEIQAVEIFTKDRSEVIEVGWDRLRSQSGISMREALEENIYDEISAVGKAPDTIAHIRDEARLVLADFVKTYLDSRGEWRSDGGFTIVDIRFTGDSAAAAVIESPRLDPIDPKLDK